MTVENREYGLGMAYRLATEQLSLVNNLGKISQASGARLENIEGRQSLVINYLGKYYRVTHPEIFIIPVDNQADITLRERLLILHYLNRAGGVPLSGKMITYQELPEGAIYAENFQKRAVNPLLEAFGRQPERLPEAAKALFDAAAGSIGDFSAIVPAFPMVPVTLVLWRGDEELTPAGNILFDSTISGYLEAEDITVLCETITRALAHFIKD